MASTFSDLKIQLMATGENSGTWGDVTNINLGTAIEEAITGSANVAFSSADVTLPFINTNETQAARNLRLNLTGTSGGARNLIVPAIEKVYIINNGLADTVTVKNAAGTGIAVPTGKTMYVYNDGTNVVDAITHLTSLTTGALTTTSTTVTGDLSIADKIVHTGDTDTAIRFPAADTVTVETNGLERVRVDSSGNVGIGTNSPAVKLDVSTGSDTDQGDISIFLGGTAANTRRASLTKTANANGDLTVTAGAGTSGSSSLIFKSNDATERMRIDSSGNVGIGTSSVSSLGSSITTLDVVGANGGGIRVERTGATASSGTFNAINGAVLLRTLNAVPLLISTNNIERMRIDSSGNVGIGTINPSERLEVNGNIQLGNGGRLFSQHNRGNLQISDPFIISAQGFNRPVSYGCNLFINSDGNFEQGASNIGGSAIVMNGPDSSFGQLAFFSKQDPDVGGALVERMRIDAFGNVLVGKTSTGSATTTVGYQVSGSGVIFSTADSSEVLNLSRLTNDGNIAVFRRGATAVGSISVTTTATAYNTSSDYRLKENLAPIENALTRVAAIPVYRFNFKSDPTKTVDGFVAHELADHVPEAVTGTKDEMRDEEYQVEAAKGEVFIPAVEAVLDDEGVVISEAVAEEIISTNVKQPETLINDHQWRETTAAVMGTRQIPAYQGVDQSKVTPLLTAALKELMAKVEALESEVALLKGQA